MEPVLLISIGAIAVLLLLSAFFSGSETALTAASRPHMHQLEQEGNRHAATVNQLSESKELVFRLRNVVDSSDTNYEVTLTSD